MRTFALAPQEQRTDTRKLLLLHVIGFALFAAHSLRVRQNSASHIPPGAELEWTATILMGPISLLRAEGARLLGLLGLIFHGLALSLAFLLRRFSLARWLSPIIWLLWVVLGARALPEL